jgi:hypothetical protein
MGKLCADLIGDGSGLPTGVGMALITISLELLQL